MNQSRTRSIGLDVHNDSLDVAYVANDHDVEVIDRRPIGTRQAAIDQRIRKMPSKAQHRVFVSAAGPCGDGLSRDLTNRGHGCWVVAPCLIPQKAGARVTTARRDAVHLARLRRSGARTPVEVTTVDDDAIRDLSRARDEAIRDLQAAQFRLNAWWLRHDLRETGHATWGPAPLRWLCEVVCATPAQPIVFQAYVRAVTEPTERLQRLDQAPHEPVKSWRLPPVVEALEGLRGVPFTGAVTRVAEVGDLTRFETPRHVMNARGLIPSAYSRGERRRQGSIPNAGQTHARRAVVEGAWAYRSPAHVRRHVPRRLAQLPKPIPDISWQAQGRLCPRVRRLMARRQHANQVVVAMARARAGVLWAMAKQVPVTPSDDKTAPSGAITQEGSPRHSEGAQPRCGATLGGVKRPKGMLVPSMRQAPDGCTSGGTQPTAISRINRRVFLAPTLLIDQGETTCGRRTKQNPAAVHS